MNLLQLAWRNLMRHRLTTSITALAGALALVQVLLISSLDAQGYRVESLARVKSLAGGVVTFL